MSSGFRIEALARTDPRGDFSSGVEPLDRYLRELANQDIKRRVSNCFVARDDAGNIAGYYTFAATSVPVTELPADQIKSLPRYPLLPAGLIGRLAVDQRFRGRHLGGAMIIDAVMRASRGDPAIFALIVDAKDDNAVRFYEHHQFRRFVSRPQSLFLPIATALQVLQGKAGTGP
jgi:ribosomal protein S18 acetylase RimI-like enzyme